MPSGAAAGAEERLREATACSVCGPLARSRREPARGGGRGGPLTTLLGVDPLDPGDPAVVADPSPSFAAARAVAPVQWHEGLGLWLAFTHTEANAVLRDRRLGRIWTDKQPAERCESFNLIHRNAILEMEPPDHTRLRRLISAAFARGHVERLRPWVEELANSLVDDLVACSQGT